MSITLICVAIVIFIALSAIYLSFRAPRNKEEGAPIDFGLDYIEKRIPTRGGKQLFAWLLPRVGSNETLIILHGWGSNAELMLPIAEPYSQANTNVLLIDARGHGGSDSDSYSSLSRFTEDLSHSIDWLKQNHPDITHKIALLGHSAGIGAVILEASKRTDISAVIGLSSFANPEWDTQRDWQYDHIPAIFRRPVILYVEWIVGFRFSRNAPLENVCKSDCPVMLVHRIGDTSVLIDDAYALIANTPQPHLSIIEVEDMGYDDLEEEIQEHSEQLVEFLGKAGFQVEALNKPSK